MNTIKEMWADIRPLGWGSAFWHAWNLTFVYLAGMWGQWWMLPFWFIVGLIGLATTRLQGYNTGRKEMLDVMEGIIDRTARRPDPWL